jgi:hypothetical protein
MATRRQSFIRLQNATLHLPALRPDDAEMPWLLLDEHAYVTDSPNATTASTTWDDKDIQVTLCLARRRASPIFASSALGRSTRVPPGSVLELLGKPIENF